jgi:hypothetical protein
LKIHNRKVGSVSSLKRLVCGDFTWLIQPGKAEKPTHNHETSVSSAHSKTMDESANIFNPNATTVCMDDNE